MAMSLSLFWKWYDKISLFQSQPLERKAFFFHYGRQNDLSGWMSRKHAQKKGLKKGDRLLFLEERSEKGKKGKTRHKKWGQAPFLVQ
jgi:hypothetical protein